MGHSSKRLVQSSPLFCALIFCLSFLADGREALAQRSKGYRVTNSSIVVETAGHWRNWQLPVHAVDVIPGGGFDPTARASATISSTTKTPLPAP